ncbi:MAG TPA: ABC transporter permease, partial [Gemmatimonadaceae bacterium]|nr:ABC transporter permease [Gemmatimonadaceae bacterium]
MPLFPMNALFRDIRYGFRSLTQSPMLAMVATLALTIGIALTTTMFSILYGALMKGLPFEEGDRIVMVRRADVTQGPGNNFDVSIQDLVDYRAQQKSLEDLAGTTSGTINVSGSDRAERYSGTWVTANAFDVLRVRPVLGRGFLPGEDKPGGPRVAVLSHEMWQKRFGGRTDVLNTTIRANGIPYTIVGVMPEGFAFPNNTRIWLNFQGDPLVGKRGQGQALEVYGRLKDGVTMDQASADFAAIAARLAKDYRESNENITASVQNYVDAYIGPQPTRLLQTMLGAVFFVLLIACANVANLLLDRAAHKTKEVGIRTALGASRGAVIRQFLTEALALSVVAAVLGLVLSYSAIGLFNRSLVDTDPPFFIDIRLHPPVIAFTVLVAILTTLLSGAIPAYQSSRADINEILKDDSRGASSFRIGRISKALVVFEIALSCGLLVAAGLMVKSVSKIRTMEMGFNPEAVFTARLGFPEGYADTVAQMQFYEQLEQKVAAIPGVTAAAITGGLPSGDAGYGGAQVGIEGKSYATDRDYPRTRAVPVTDRFFATLEIPVRSGRVFNSGDRPGATPVAVVNEKFVKQFFPDGNAIGRRIRTGTSKTTEPWLTIVGVVGDVFAGDPENPKPPVIYRPLSQSHTRFVYVAARTRGQPLQLTNPVRSAVASLNPDIPLYWVYSLREAIARPLWFIRVFGTMFMIFGFIALFLASIGLYAVMSFSVSRRTREVGIRMALGARGGDVVRMIFRQGAVQLAIGMVLGLGL